MTHYPTVWEWDAIEEGVRLQEELIVKQQRWITRLYWLCGIGWTLAGAFAILWGMQ